MQTLSEVDSLHAAPQLSVVIPCYNEQEGMAELHKRVTAVCRDAVGDSYEFVLINDGSSDSTWSVMRAQAALDPHLVCVNLSRNHGHQLALSAGLQVCRGMRVLVLDADLQDPPELLPRMMKMMDDGCDVVYGQRTKRQGETVFKRATAALFYRLLDQLVDIDIAVDSGDFRLISRRAVDCLNQMPEHDRFIRGMVSWIGLRQEPIQYERAARFAGVTKYPFSKMLQLALDAVTGFSIRPLRIASYLGILCGIGGLLQLIHVFWAWYSNETVQGWTSLMAVVLVIGSAQLLVAGVMGEYLGRLYIESKGRPLYIIQDIIRSSPERSTIEVKTAQRA